MTCQTSHAFHLFFIIPFLGFLPLAVTRCPIPLLYFWTFSPLILFLKMALCLQPARPGCSRRIKGHPFALLPSVNEQSQRGRKVKRPRQEEKPSGKKAKRGEISRCGKWVIKPVTELSMNQITKVKSVPSHGFTLFLFCATVFLPFALWQRGGTCFFSLPWRSGCDSQTEAERQLNREEGTDTCEQERPWETTYTASDSREI